MPWCAVWHSLAANQLGVLGLALKKNHFQRQGSKRRFLGTSRWQATAGDLHAGETYCISWGQREGFSVRSGNIWKSASGIFRVSFGQFDIKQYLLIGSFRLKLRMVALLLYCEGRSSWILSTGGSRTSGRSFNQFQHHFVLQRSSSGSFMLSAGFVVCSRVKVSIKSQFWCLDHTSYTENYMSTATSQDF